MQHLLVASKVCVSDMKFIILRSKNDTRVTLHVSCLKHKVDIISTKKKMVSKY